MANVLNVKGLDTLQELADASAGLLVTSETDAPFEPVYLGLAGDCEELTEAVMQQLVPEFRAVSMLDRAIAGPDPVDQFFDEPPCEEGDDDKWQNLYDVLTDVLEKPRVFCVGRGPAITVYLVGRTNDGAFVGLKTVKVET